jgi:hypothetical protein
MAKNHLAANAFLSSRYAGCGISKVSRLDHLCFNSGVMNRSPYS